MGAELLVAIIEDRENYISSWQRYLAMLKIPSIAMSALDEILTAIEGGQFANVSHALVDMNLSGEDPDHVQDGERIRDALRNSASHVIIVGVGTKELPGADFNYLKTEPKKLMDWFDSLVS